MGLPGRSVSLNAVPALRPGPLLRLGVWDRGFFLAGRAFFFPFLSHYGVGSARELRKSGRNGSLVFFSFSSSRDVQSQSPQAQGSEPFSSRHLRRSCASCTLTRSKYSSQ